jgi:hypothetical protein
MKLAFPPKLELNKVSCNLYLVFVFCILFSFVCESCHLQFWVFFFFGYVCVCRIGTLRFSLLVVCVSLTICFPCFMHLCPWLFFVNVSGVFNFCYLFIFNHVLLFFLYMCKFLFLTFHVVTNVVHVLILKRTYGLGYSIFYNFGYPFK